MKNRTKILLVVLRMGIGWHFLYEGVIKLFQTDWSSMTYLKGSYGFFSGFYHWMAADPGMVQAVDFITTWGMILLGAGLILGVLTRVSAVSGMLFLALYYVAYPPFGAEYTGLGTDGHYWIFNRNLIEMIALAVIVRFPINEYSLVHFARVLFRGSNGQPAMQAADPGCSPVRETMKEKSSGGRSIRGKVQEDGSGNRSTGEEMQEDGSGYSSRRREMLKGLATLPFFGGLLIGSVARAKTIDPDAITGSTITLKDSDLTDLKGVLPRGKLGELEFGRIIMGHNLIGGTTHTRDLLYSKELFLRYNTKERVLKTYALAEQAGITMVNVTTNSMPILNEYKKRSGSEMMSMAQVHFDRKSNDPLTYYKKFMEWGASTMYVMGMETDNLVMEGRLEPIQEAVEFVQSQGYQAGIAAHSVQSVIACEKAGINPDYYFKTMHHDNYWSATPRGYREEFSMSKGNSPDHNRYHDNMWDVFPGQTVDVLQKVEVPVVGFKVLAAGAIPPADGFRYAFENGADFICVGMFDFQVVEDVNIATEVLGGPLNRVRPWYS